MNRLIITLLVLVAPPLLAQEICNNGIDDDGDGFIDCYDGDCANDNACDGSFLGNDANCEAIPSEFPQFTMTLDFASPNETTNHFARMAVGDLDRDGMPEIITMNRYTRKLFILNGNDGSIKHEVDAGFEPYWEIAIGNIDDDNCAELFFIGYLDLPGNNNDGVYIFSYDCQLNFLWRTAERLRADPINYGLADFDGDGLVELYAKDEIYDAHTGTRIVRTAANSANEYRRLNGGPVAADIVADGRLELILGLSIYQVNLGTRTQDSGSLTLLQSRNEYFVRDQYNATSVADYNQDGFLDILASGSTVNHDQNTTIFFWDVQNNVLTTYRDLTGDYAPDGWQNGTGRINIADLDGDGNLNASYVSGKYLYALDHNLQLHWRIVINEETSGYTGCTLFDFNGDGKSEIVYRDEQFLYIIDGTDGSIFSQQACISRTNREYPIVADVDADGATELCVTCGFNDADAWANFNNASYSRYAHVRVFKSASEPWVPARRLWNQHGYFVVNVNDDLTIPRTLQKHHLVFSTGSCTQGPNRPLNKFLNQAPYLNSDGCPTYASPDLAFANVPTANPPTCPDLNYTVSFDVTNLGDVPLSGNVPVTFYSSNPAKPGAVKFNTITMPLSNLLPGGIFSVVDAPVIGNGSDSLYIVLNDAGTTVPTPISLPNTDFLECDYDNIIGIPVRPLPVSITAIPENPNNSCAEPANGVASAFIPTGGVENTADYNFYWFDGAVAMAIGDADFIGPIYTELQAGTYSVYAIHKTANCNSDTVQVVIDAGDAGFPDATVVVTDQTLCNPPNGSAEVFVEGGNAGYTFEWEDAIAPIGVSGPLLTNRNAGTYRVNIISPGGCQRTVDAEIRDEARDPDVEATATPITVCNDPNGGSVSAVAVIPGDPVPPPIADYTFNWYFYDDATNTRGSQLPAVHGAAGTPNRTSLSVGFYEVEVTEIATGCLGTTTEIVEITNQAVLPAVQFTQLAPQTSCDPNNPNGVLAADALDGGVVQDPAGYSFEWFVGQNTLPANAHTDVSGVNGRIAEKLKGGGQAYTVRIINLATQCVAVEHTTVNENIISPVVALNKTDNGICDPLLASGDFTGSVAASVSFDGTPVNDFTNYTFTWYNGQLATGTPRPETTSTITGLNTGYYTVVVARTDIACAAPPQTAEVVNATVLPSITTSAAGSSNCLPLAPGITPNGSALVTDVDGAGTPALYAFQWHTGNGTTTPINGETNTALSGIQGGAGMFYTVLVTNTVNGCQNTATVNVPDVQELPLITLSSTDNSICTGTPDGTASLTTLSYQGANVPAPYTGYTFSWSTGGTTPSINSLAAGLYTLTVTKTDVGCTSDPVDVEVEDNLFIPPIDIVVTTQTSCDNLNPNGSLAASVDETGIGGSTGVITGYNFTWVNNGNPFALPGADGGNTSTISNLNGDLFYTVTAQHITSGCTNQESVFLPATIAIPVVAAAVSSNVTRCDTPNGSVVANVGGAQVGYTFFWLNEVGSNQTADNTVVVTNADATITDDGNYPGLIPGYYTVVARDNTTSCISQPVTRVVLDNIVQSSITITPGPVLPSACGANDGQMSATVSGGVGPFNLFWHYGGPVNSDINFFNNPPQFTPPDDTPFATILGSSVSNLDNLESRLYTLIVRDQGNGCGNYQSIFLPFIDAHTVSTNVIPATNCTFFNGQIEVTVNDIIAPNDFQDFTYRLYRGENPNPALQIGPVVGPGAAVTSPMVYSSLEPGKYTVEVRQDLAVFGSECSVFQVVEVVPNAFSPLVSIQSFAANTACDMVAADGAVTIQVDIDPRDQTTGFTYDIDVNPAPLGWGGPVTIGPYLPPPLPDDFTVPGMSPLTVVPQYTITVTSNNCTTQRIVSIPNNPLNSQLLSGNITIANAEHCISPAGSIEVNAIDVLGGNGSDPDFTNLANYEFTWFDNATLVPAGGIFQAQGGDALPGERLDQNSYPAIGPGSYWIVSRKNQGTRGIGCASAPFKADILDISRDPVFTLTPFDNTACDANFEGSLQITVTDPGSLPTPTYSYIWDGANPAPILVVSGDGDGIAADDNHPNLPDGTFRLTVTNDVTGCSATRQATIIQTATPIIVANADPVHQMICNPDGSITVIDVFVGGVVDPIHTNFDFTWFVDDPNNVPIINEANGADVLNIGNYPTIGAGTYYVKAKRLSGLPLGSGCESAPLRVEILDLSQDPDADFTSLQPNSSCDPAIPNGSIIANAFERDATVDTYTFAWTYNAGALPGMVLQTDVSPTSQLGNSPEGNYAVTVNNTLTGCTVTRGISLILDQTLSLPNIVEVIPTNPVDCHPTGSAQVVEITIGGSTTYTNPPDDLDTDFDYEWYKGTTLPAGLLAGELNSSLLNQLPDKYFVLVRDLTTNCQSTFIEVVIDSADIIYPDVKIRQTTPQIVCDVTSLGGSATLIATVDLTRPVNSRNSFGNYEVFWFENLQTLGAPMNAASDTVITNLLSGDYSVSVLDLTTSCRASALFIVPEDSVRFKPILALAASPLTECDSIDGFVTAEGLKFPSNPPPPPNIHPFPYDYTADLFFGASPNLNNPPDVVMVNDPNNPMNPEFFLEPNLSPGIYTVRLTDNNTGCIAIKSVEVSDQRIFPVPNLTTIAPITNCDPAKPNGVARADVNGNFIGYRFEWYEGNTVAGQPFYTGVEYGELKPTPQEYLVQATDLVTGCSGTVVTTFNLGTLPIPLPTIVVLSHVTSCLVDNGALAASVGGNTKDYVFDWYDGTQEVPPPDFIGEIYSDLAIGTYSVTATSKITGCKSPLVSEDILDRKELPTFDFEIQTASCDQANGFARIFITSETEVTRIEWRDANGVITVGPNLAEAFAGLYNVTVTTILGCVSSQDLEISADIRPFNGISRNGDDQNAYFHIDCIDNFQNNIVKIFNRAGTLVYEAVGYDNNNIYFDGLSNRGISPMGKNLPDGTYFYIVDKRDGSKPIAGYLEIVN
jgi:large repetitive protein